MSGSLPFMGPQMGIGMNNSMTPMVPPMTSPQSMPGVPSLGQSAGLPGIFGTQQPRPQPSNNPYASMEAPLAALTGLPIPRYPAQQMSPQQQLAQVGIPMGGGEGDTSMGGVEHSSSDVSSDPNAGGAEAAAGADSGTNAGS